MSKEPKTLSREKLTAATRNFAMAFQQLNSQALPALVAEIEKIYKIVNLLDRRIKALEPKDRPVDVVAAPENKGGSKTFNESMQEIINDTEPEKANGNTQQTESSEPKATTGTEVRDLNGDTGKPDEKSVGAGEQAV